MTAEIFRAHLLGFDNVRHLCNLNPYQAIRRLLSLQKVPYSLSC